MVQPCRSRRRIRRKKTQRVRLNIPSNLWTVIPIVVVNRSPRHGFVVEEGDFPRRLIALRARNEDTPPSFPNFCPDAHFCPRRRSRQVKFFLLAAKEGAPVGGEAGVSLCVPAHTQRPLNGLAHAGARRALQGDGASEQERSAAQRVGRAGATDSARWCRCTTAHTLGARGGPGPTPHVFTDRRAFTRNHTRRPGRPT